MGGTPRRSRDDPGPLPELRRGDGAVSKKAYLWFGAMFALAFVLAFVFSEVLVELTAERFVYGGDGCPESEKYTCATPGIGGMISVILGAVVAAAVTYPIARSMHTNDL